MYEDCSSDAACSRFEDAFDDVVCILAGQLSDVDGDAGFTCKCLPEFFA